jgi:hypothetical protein
VWTLLNAHNADGKKPHKKRFIRRTMNSQKQKQKTPEKTPLVYLLREIILEVSSFPFDEQEDEDLRMTVQDLAGRSSKALADPLNFDLVQLAELYEQWQNEAFTHFLEDAESSIKKGQFKTGINTNPGGYGSFHYETEEVAIQVTGIPSLYVGFTRFFGGGKWDDAEVDWKQTCYFVKGEDRVQTVKIFSVREID